MKHVIILDPSVKWDQNRTIRGWNAELRQVNSKVGADV